MDAATALRNLTRKMEAIESDSQFQSMFTLAWCHEAEYKGPNWGEELAAAQAVLAEIDKEEA